MLLWLGLWAVLVAAIVIVLLVVRRPPPEPTPVKLDEGELPQPLLETRSLEAEMRDRYLQAWDAIQPVFVHDPEVALRETDKLLQNVMRDCGYPTGDFGRLRDDVTEEQLRIVESYRAGHRITVKGETTMLEEGEIARARAGFQDVFERLVAAIAPSSSPS
jgi:hypothetical protein